MGIPRRRRGSGSRQKYAAEQAELGHHYLRSAPETGQRPAQAIACFNEVLRIFAAEADPLGYAQIQHYMGNAYRELPGGDRAVNLGKAIGCYTQALRFRTAEATSLHYAATQNELGAAYAGLRRGPGGEPG